MKYTGAHENDFTTPMATLVIGPDARYKVRLLPRDRPRGVTRTVFGVHRRHQQVSLPRWLLCYVVVLLVDCPGPEAAQKELIVLVIYAFVCLQTYKCANRKKIYCGEH